MLFFITRTIAEKVINEIKGLIIIQKTFVIAENVFFCFAYICFKGTEACKAFKECARGRDMTVQFSRCQPTEESSHGPCQLHTTYYRAYMGRVNCKALLKVHCTPHMVCVS